MIIKAIKYFPLTFLLFCNISFVFAQNNDEIQEKSAFSWNILTNTFLDNQEFARSSYIKDRTFGGVNFVPQGGLKFGKGHSIFAGLNLLKEFGTQQVIDRATPIIFYKNETFSRNDCIQSFRAGIFPRETHFSNFSDLLFWQPLTNYMPVIQGLFYQIRRKNNFANVWIDWTGKPSTTDNESFYAGLSGRATFKSYFVDFQGYYFHFANTEPKDPDFKLCDNGQALLRVGYDFEDKLVDFQISAGVMAGYENERGVDNQKFMPFGFVANARFEISRFGVDNWFYAGDKRLQLYAKHGERLYCANPFLQGNFYLQSEIYWKIFDSKAVASKIGMLAQVSESKLMFEQRFLLSIFLSK
ncbi:MAG: hypothetical protein LBB41_01250 [Prevotellaceae bacterium]|jgi:hypothetical protein|nr:hypothetical protein [Prevotellaceae bacterium]